MSTGLKIVITRCLDLFEMLLFDPRLLLRKIVSLPGFILNSLRYRKLNRNSTFKITLADISYHSYDQYSPAARIDQHYFFQDLWAARTVFENRPQLHVDIGSRVDGFISHLLLFTRVCYIDIRPLYLRMEDFDYRQGSLMQIPFESESIDSLSSLHVLEHAGLGRYGDPVDPEAYIKAAGELQRVLRPGGIFLLAAPVGRERLCFDGHRIFDPLTLIKLFPQLDLLEFSLVDDKGEAIIRNCSLEKGRECRYGCGLFKFTKSL